MIIGNVPNEDILKALSVENILEIKSYIDNPMTATTFSKKNLKTEKSNNGRGHLFPNVREQYSDRMSKVAFIPIVHIVTCMSWSVVRSKR